MNAVRPMSHHPNERSCVEEDQNPSQYKRPRLGRRLPTPESSRTVSDIKRIRNLEKVVRESTEPFNLADSKPFPSDNRDLSRSVEDSRSQETGLQRNSDQQSLQTRDYNHGAPRSRTNSPRHSDESRPISPRSLGVHEPKSLGYPDFQKPNLLRCPDVHDSKVESRINKSNLIPISTHESAECPAESSSLNLFALNQEPTLKAPSNSNPFAPNSDSGQSSPTSRKKQREKSPKFSWGLGSDSSDSEIESIEPIYVSKKKVSTVKGKHSKKRQVSPIFLGSPIHVPKTNLPREKSPMILESAPKRIQVETPEPDFGRSSPEIIILDEESSSKKILVAAVSPFKPVITDQVGQNPSRKPILDEVPESNQPTISKDQIKMEIENTYRQVQDLVEMYEYPEENPLRMPDYDELKKILKIEVSHRHHRGLPSQTDFMAVRGTILSIIHIMTPMTTRFL